MFYLTTPNAAINVENVDCVKWELGLRSEEKTRTLVAYVSFESGKKEKLEGADAHVLRDKLEALARREIQRHVPPENLEVISEVN